MSDSIRKHIQLVEGLVKEAIAAQQPDPTMTFVQKLATKFGAKTLRKVGRSAASGGGHKEYVSTYFPLEFNGHKFVVMGDDGETSHLTILKPEGLDWTTSDWEVIPDMHGPNAGKPVIQLGIDGALAEINRVLQHWVSHLSPVGKAKK